MKRCEGKWRWKAKIVKEIMGISLYSLGCISCGRKAWCPSISGFFPPIQHPIQNKPCQQDESPVSEQLIHSEETFMGSTASIQRCLITCAKQVIGRGGQEHSSPSFLAQDLPQEQNSDISDRPGRGRNSLALHLGYYVKKNDLKSHPSFPYLILFPFSLPTPLKNSSQTTPNNPVNSEVIAR